MRCLFLLIGCLLAAVCHASGRQFNLESAKANTATMSFRLVNNLIIIPLHINLSDTLHFILDTGSRNTIFFQNDSTQNPLDKANLLPAFIRGIGMDQAYIPAFQSRGNTMHLPGITGTNLDILYFDASGLDFASFLGCRVDGILGTDLFHDFIVRVQYARKKIQIYRPGTPYSTKKAIAISLQMELGRPYLQIPVDAGHGKFKAKLLIDLGESKPISLLADSHPQLLYPERFTIASLGVGLGGAVSGYIARIPGLELGKYRLEEVIASFPDESSLPQMHFTDGRHGSLGAGILKKFECVFDFADQMLYLRNTEDLDKPYLYNRLGAELAATGEHYSRFRISFVIPHTPAAFFGLQKDDEIIAVNGRNTKNKTLDQVWRRINDSKNDYITLKVLRNNTVHVIDILLFNIL
jgi:hypothetical protein